MPIRKVGDGAYFVPSYSEQTIQSFHPLFTSQTIMSGEIGTQLIEPLESEIDKSEENITNPDFEKAITRVSNKFPIGEHIREAIKTIRGNKD